MCMCAGRRPWEEQPLWGGREITVGMSLLCGLPSSTVCVNKQRHPPMLCFFRSPLTLKKLLGHFRAGRLRIVKGFNLEPEGFQQPSRR